MDIKHRLTRWFKPRFAVAYPFVLYVLIFGHCDEASVRHGIGFIIAGILIRLWSNGYAIKNDRLTISGPYSFVRNPLYLGTFLIILGFVITLHMGWVGAGLLLVLGLAYYQTIQGEQANLTAKFGDAYRRYKEKVPAMVPCLIPYSDGEQWPFSLERLYQSKEHKPVFWIIILLIGFHLKSRLLLEHKPMTTKAWFWVALAAVLILIDITYEINKKKS